MVESYGSSSGTRFVELDGLRGIAALWVVLHHYTGGVRVWLPGRSDMVAQITPWSGPTYGLLAVHLFFMISGFVIMMTVERSRNIGDFIVSRMARLYPAYWCALAVSVAVAVFLPLPVYSSVTLAQVLVNISMAQGFLGVPHVDDVYWSLTYELGFYFLAGLALLLGAIRHAERLAAAWVGMSIFLQSAVPGFLALLPWRVQALFVVPYSGLFVAGYVFYRIRTQGSSPWRLALLGVCFVQQLINARHSVLDVVEVGAFTAAFFAIFVLCIRGHAAILRHPLLVWLGTISYPLYLSHPGVGIRVQFALHALGLPPWAILMGATSFAVGLAWLISVVVERPGGRTIRRAAMRWQAGSKPLPVIR